MCLTAAMDNMRLAAELEKREQIQAERFRKAGIAPVQKTFKYNPKTNKPEQQESLRMKN